MRERTARTARLAPLLAILAAFAAPMAGAVKGTVINSTTGLPAPDVLLTLASFRGGMTPVDETVSAADGSFEFAKDLPDVSEGQPFAGAIRAEFDGVFYTEIIARESQRDDVSITVYSASAENLPSPSSRVVIMEPGSEAINVHETYMILNASSPPVTFSSEAGTLRFFLPEGAGGEVDVTGTGPVGMPLSSSALPAGEPGLYKVDFPLKPGASRISLSYGLPRSEGSRLTIRAAYAGMETKVAVPQGVSLSGTGADLVDEHPETGALVYDIAGADAVNVEIVGEGSLPRSSPASAGASPEISIEPAPIAAELAWIAAISVLILGVGFFHFLRSAAPRGHGASQVEDS